MPRLPHRFTPAFLLSLLSVPCRAADDTGLVSVAPALVLALLWLILLGIGAHALLRSMRRAGRQRARGLAQLATERASRASAERLLADSHIALCRAVREQDGVKEAERRRIARDIHDDLGQNLLALKIELSLLQVSTNGVHPLVNQKLGAIIGNVDHTIASLRAIINDLRPLALDQGLQSAVEQKLSDFTRINGIQHELHATLAGYEGKPDRQLDAMMFRILQEALANIARHAHATEVQVTLARTGNELVLKVADNGIGMHTHPATRGSGLSGIRDRVTALGGKFIIDSGPGTGTLLSLWIPAVRRMHAH